MFIVKHFPELMRREKKTLLKKADNTAAFYGNKFFSSMYIK